MLSMAITPKMFPNGTPSGLVTFIYHTELTTLPKCSWKRTLAGLADDPTYCKGKLLQGPSFLAHVILYTTKASLHVTWDVIGYVIPVEVLLWTLASVDLGQTQQSTLFPQCLNPGLNFLVSWNFLRGNLALIKMSLKFLGRRNETIGGAGNTRTERSISKNWPHR